MTLSDPGRRVPALLLAGLLLVKVQSAARAESAPSSGTATAPESQEAEQARPRTDAPLSPVERVEVRGEAGPAAPLDPSAFATVIRAEDFADRITSIPELLREVVGVQVHSLGGDFATVSIRGSTAEQVMVYLDGVPLNHVLGGGVNIADLPLAQVESIAVYRGFTPASLPASSIGGAILIETRRPDGGSAASAAASYGSFGTSEAVASWAGKRGRAAWILGADSKASRGDFTFLDTHGTEFSSIDESVARRVNNDFRRDHASARLSIPAGARARLGVSLDVLSSDQGVPGLGQAESRLARFGSSRALIRTDIEVPGLFGGRLLARGAADYTLYTESFSDPRGTLGSGEETDNTIGSFGQEIGLVLVASRRQGISLLGSHRRDTADLARHVPFEPSDLGTAVRDDTTLTLEDQVSFAGGRLLLNPSLRREAYDNRFAPGPATGSFPPSLGTADARIIGKVGFRAVLTGSLSLKGNFGRFLRLPDMIELFGNRGSVLGNPALVPESGRNVDLGIVASRRARGPILRRARLEANLFETLSDDLINFVQNPQATVIAQNVGRARIRGAEVALDLALGPRFTGSLNLTRQRVINFTGDRNNGRELPFRPDDEITAGMGLAVGRGRIVYTFTYVGPNFVDAENTASRAVPGRYLHDLGYRLSLPRGLQAVFQVENLGDDRTYDVARYPLPGRSYDARLIWTF